MNAKNQNPDENMLSRTELLLGADKVNILKKSHVAVFGLGGVGGYTAESLARSGIGSLCLVDADRVSKSNINRQIYALNSTVGQYKTDTAKRRILDINPDIDVQTYNIFFMPDTQNFPDFSQFDYVADAVDTVSAKIEIIIRAKNAGVPVISCMGMGNRLDPCSVKVADIYSTSHCPLARVMRHELRKRNIGSLKTVCSSEIPVRHGGEVPASNAFVPSVAGMIMASEIIRDLTNI